MPPPLLSPKMERIQQTNTKNIQKAMASASDIVVVDVVITQTISHVILFQCRDRRERSHISFIFLILQFGSIFFAHFVYTTWGLLSAEAKSEDSKNKSRVFRSVCLRTHFNIFISTKRVGKHFESLHVELLNVYSSWLLFTLHFHRIPFVQYFQYFGNAKGEKEKIENKKRTQRDRKPTSVESHQK